MIFSPQRFLTLKVELADAAQSNGYHFRHQHPQLTYTIYQHHTLQTHRSPGKKMEKIFVGPKKKNCETKFFLAQQTYHRIRFSTN